MIAGSAACSIPQFKQKCHTGTYLQLFQGIDCFKPTIIEVQGASSMICKVSCLTSQIRRLSILEDFKTYINEVLKEHQSNIAEGIEC
jgi:hypothetical protein